MPELPEVETVVRTLRPRLVGAKVSAVWTSGFPLRMAVPLDLKTLERISRASIARVARRGKFIVIETAAGGQILVHLGMTGRLRVQPASDEREKHTHVVWTLDRGRELRFVDPRRFGLVRAAPAGEVMPELAELGPDPIDELDVGKFALDLAGSRAPIKAFLLDQSKLAGLGNIYVCEALFRARINPRTPARRVRARAEVLASAIRESLMLGIANRGTTLRDYVDAEGGAGENQHALLVYGRQGAPCRTCGRAIKRRVDAQRSTFYCGACQR